jgi:hypothetical protein
LSFEFSWVFATLAGNLGFWFSTPGDALTACFFLAVAAGFFFMQHNSADFSTIEQEQDEYQYEKQEHQAHERTS